MTRQEDILAAIADAWTVVEQLDTLLTPEELYELLKPIYGEAAGEDARLELLDRLHTAEAWVRQDLEGQPSDGARWLTDYLKNWKPDPQKEQRAREHLEEARRVRPVRQ